MRAMKDSGVEWLGDIPKDWTIRPHRAVLTEKKVPVGGYHNELTLLSLTKQGVIVRDMDAGGKFPASFEGYQRVEQGDLVLCLFDVEETPRTVGLSPKSGMITSAYTVMHVSGVDAKFLEWYLIGMDNEKRFKPFYSGLRNVLPKPVFGSIRFAMPSVEEQRDIADYLDHETSQIDLLISKKEQLIEKLLERRQALITRAVTKGLDPNVPMKDSDVDFAEYGGLVPPSRVAPNEWLAGLPKDWKIVLVKHIFVFNEKGRGSDSERILSLTQGGIVERDISGNEGQIAESYENYPQVIEGDFVLNPMDLVAGWVARTSMRGKVSGAYYSFHLNDQEKADGRFFEYLFQTYYRQRIFDRFGSGLGRMESGGGRWTLGRDVLMNFPIALPPLHVQRSLATYLDDETSQVDSLVEKARKSIELLKERRQALITAVVTGKLDVRGFTGGNS